MHLVIFQIRIFIIVYINKDYIKENNIEKRLIDISQILYKTYFYHPDLGNDFLLTNINKVILWDNNIDELNEAELIEQFKELNESGNTKRAQIINKIENFSATKLKIITERKLFLYLNK